MDVLVVQSKIPAGSDLQAIKSSVKLASLPAASVPNGALKSLDGLDGKVSGVDLLPGEALLGARLVDPTSLAAPGSVPVPAGLQEISVHLDAQRVVGGRIAAGDTVGVVVLLEDPGAQGAAGGTAQMVFHKVLVTSVQRAASQSKTSTQGQTGQEQTNTQVPDGDFIVTFARNSVDSTKIAFGAKYGDIWLTKEPATSTDDQTVLIKKAQVIQ